MYRASTRRTAKRLGAMSTMATALRTTVPADTIVSIEGDYVGSRELLFVVHRTNDGRYVAHAIGESIAVETKTLRNLRKEIRAAVCAYFHPIDPGCPKAIRLHIVREEVLPVWE